jgi:hypothetical protein
MEGNPFTSSTFGACDHMLSMALRLKHLLKGVPSFDELVNHLRVCWIKHKRNSCERVDASVEEKLVDKTTF